MILNYSFVFANIRARLCVHAIMEFVVSSRIRGYHVYRTVWTAVLGEELLCERETGNVVDRYTVALKKPGSGVIVDHLPKKISRCCSMFIL